MGRAFVRAGKQEQPLDVSSLSEFQISYSKAIYGCLRALTENFRKAFKVVRFVKSDNGLEAWRRLTRKFDPQNPKVHAAQLEHIVTFGNRGGASLLQQQTAAPIQLQGSTPLFPGNHGGRGALRRRRPNPGG